MPEEELASAPDALGTGTATCTAPFSMPPVRRKAGKTIENEEVDRM